MRFGYVVEHQKTLDTCLFLAAYFDVQGLKQPLENNGFYSFQRISSKIQKVLYKRFMVFCAFYNGVITFFKYVKFFNLTSHPPIIFAKYNNFLSRYAAKKNTCLIFFDALQHIQSPSKSVRDTSDCSLVSQSDVNMTSKLSFVVIASKEQINMTKN